MNYFVCFLTLSLSQFWQSWIILDAFSLVTQRLQLPADADFDWGAVDPDQHEDVDDDLDDDQHDAYFNEN